MFFPITYAIGIKTCVKQIDFRFNRTNNKVSESDYFLARGNPESFRFHCVF